MASHRQDVPDPQRVEAALDARRPEWNAYRIVDPDGARARARAVAEGGVRGPLAGMPVSIKDLFGCPGFDTYAGSPNPLPPRFERPGPLIQRLLALGAVPVGKTHTVEFAFGGIGSNDHWGTPTNPRCPDRVPGGSTAGAAASLVEGSADLAFGTDTAGSVRIPASFSGTVGFKPGPGHWSTDGIVPLSPTLDSPGILARSVEDVVRAVHAIDGTDRPPAPTWSQLRFGVLERLFDRAESQVVETVRAALDRLGQAGAAVESLRVPEVGASLRLFAKGTVTGTEFAAFLRTQLPTWEETLQPTVRVRMERGAAVAGPEYLRRRHRIRKLTDRAQRRFLFGQVWVAPTTACRAPQLQAVQDPDGYDRENMRALRNTSVANGLGLCALSLPLADSDGVPVGLMLMGPRGAEAFLLEVAVLVERQLGGGESSS